MTNKMTKRVAGAALGVGLLMGGLAIGSAADAAGGDGASFCGNNGAPSGEPESNPGNIGERVSWVTQTFGHSAESNPGNAMNEHPPFGQQLCLPN